MIDPKAIVQKFSKKDLKSIENQGITLNVVQEQLTRFQQGFPPANLTNIVSPGNGVKVLNEPEIEALTNYYANVSSQKQIYKFVPASGAASRMFRPLFGWLQDPEVAMKKDGDNLNTFFQQIRKFAFYESLSKKLLEEGKHIEQLLKKKNYAPILQSLLNDTGLGYGQLPKALLKFHKYTDRSRTAIEEHLVEGANYCVGANRTVNLHITLSDQHIASFEKHMDEVQRYYEDLYNVTFQISISTQNTATNTIAVTPDNQPFRDENGELVFRPGGHGALLENLNQIDADIVFIKNVDNVVPDRLKPTTFKYKKVLGGLLCEYQKKIFDYLREIDQGTENELSLALENELTDFFQKELCLILPTSFQQWTGFEKKDYIYQKLNRPLRMCGIVETSGKTGGGPYWVLNTDNSISLQLVESPQIDMTNPIYKEIYETSTYFNITDLACAFRDYRGKKFDLMKYRDKETGFISQKSKNGRDLKALELPGLWNGSMADWNTIFIEVPTITFNPVKTVTDLLNDAHLN